ncbi:MAG: CoA ester lyase [Pseudomonadota bacterium]
MNTANSRLLRSVLYVPADKPRAIAKSVKLDTDAIIFDLEDAVALSMKAEGRENLRAHFRKTHDVRALQAIRINAFDTEFATEDFLAARACNPDAIVLPKVASTADLEVLFDALDETDAPASIRVWAMIETARGVANAAQIAQQMQYKGSRLDAFIAGTNDLFKETGVSGPKARKVAHPWLMQIVLGARCGGLSVIDGVFNDHSDAAGFRAHCEAGSGMGFDGVSVIHPNQISTANEAYAPAHDQIEEAQAIVTEFKKAENAERGVISVGGRMVERLHLAEAEALLAKVAIIENEIRRR